MECELASPAAPSKKRQVPEFLSFGFIFNFNKKLVTAIFNEFDVDDTMSLDHGALL